MGLCLMLLLIVLNGIEMYEALQRWKEVAQLLIVLNGIEIHASGIALHNAVDF